MPEIRAFIIRPFGVKHDIDFDAVEAKLIDPVLTRLGVTGRTTGEIVSQGNIREDMFRLLLTADIVVADLSIHNPNAFYELGIRHALRNKHTFLLRASVDAYPFDLQTDRYFTYDKSYFTCVNKERAPGEKCRTKELTAEDVQAFAASVEALYKALRDTIDSDKPNSPVFALLPKMKEQDPSRFLVVPREFNEEVERAAAERRLGDLGLLAAEARNLGFEWGVEGLRAVGRAQYDLKDWVGAKNTWEAVRRTNREYDLDANIRLGTIHEKLGRVTDSMQALDRALSVEEIPKDKKAEAYALKGRNAKTLWREEWKGEPDATAKATRALQSGRLKESFENYQRACEEDLNHFYSGLNALAMLKVRTELAAALPDVWGERFDTDEEAEQELTKLKALAAKLAAYVELALDTTMARLKREGTRDAWAEVSVADLRLLTLNKPQRVGAAYREALAGAKDLVIYSASSQLALYKELGVLSANVDEALKVTGPPKHKADERERILIFTGHRVDPPGRQTPRFPATKEAEAAARQKIKEAVQAELNSDEGVAYGIAGGASGGDILFHEVCEELGVATHLYLALVPGLYVNASVREAGGDWVDRFWRLHRRLEQKDAVRVLCELPEEPPDPAEYLPAWLRLKEDYNIWQRNNLWMLQNALAAGGDDCVTLIALWDRKPTGDGPGGTSDLVDRVERRGAKTVVIDTRQTFGLQ